MNDIYRQIYENVCKMPVIDTHEHLPYSEDVRVRNTDVLKEYLTHYISSDLISAGLKPDSLKEATNTRLPLMERWELLEPYWEVCRYTGYGRALDIAVNGIYGIEGINRQTIETLNENFIRSLSPGHFKYVLKDLCNIQLSIIDCWSGQFECDRSMFRRVWQPGTAIMQYTGFNPFCDTVSWYESTYNIKISSLDDWMHAFCVELEDNFKNGIIALKNTSAYHRSLRFDKVDYKTAFNDFKSAFEAWDKGGRDMNAVVIFSTAVQDFMMHYVLQKANEKGLTFQFHTGLQEGNGNNISNSDPSLMVNLFTEYPNVKFDLFHISYPYYLTACALCKNFPNVFIDMCWAHIISPNASMQALSEFLDAVPYNKISAFGGDYIFVDGIYGHLYLARQNVSRVLAKKVRDGVFSADKAIDIGHALFYENPKHIFNL